MPVDLIDVLRSVERFDLPVLLQNRDVEEWNSVDITFHLPHIERLWVPWKDEYRLNLHVLHPCAPAEALYHPHAWPAAIHIVRGKYRMATGFGKIEPVKSYWIEFAEGSYYDMIHPDAWHAECPDGGPALTVTLSARPWTPRREAPKSPYPLGPLSDKRKREIVEMFREVYGLS